MSAEEGVEDDAGAERAAKPLRDAVVLDRPKDTMGEVWAGSDLGLGAAAAPSPPPKSCFGAAVPLAGPTLFLIVLLPFCKAVLKACL